MTITFPADWSHEDCVKWLRSKNLNWYSSKVTLPNKRWTFEISQYVKC